MLHIMSPSQISTNVGIGVENKDLVFSGTNCNIITEHNSISVDDLIVIVSTMGKLLIDIAKDDELSERYPYLRDAAFRLALDRLKK